jgi:ribonuclease P protein component
MKTECLEARVSASLLRYARIGIVVPKHGRDVVDRNRTKRRLREIVRLHLLPGVEGVDVVLRASPQAYIATFDQLAHQVNTIAAWISTSITRG